MSCAFCRSLLFAAQLTAYLFIFTVVVKAQQPVVGPHDHVVSYGKLPLSFEPNLGQTDPEVKFLARGKHYVLFLTNSGTVLRVLNSTASNAISQENAKDALATSVLGMHLEGIRRASRVVAVGQLPGRVNYFTGNDRAKWQKDLPTYSRVEYEEIYPGIQLVYYGEQGRLEYDFIVSPRADPSQITLHFDGAVPTLDTNGDLILPIAGGDIRFAKPVAYQPRSGVRKHVAARYLPLAGNRVSFAMGAYDRNQPLVIDPLLVYSSYLGGSNIDRGNAIAVDAAGNAYVTGETLSVDFPTKNPLENFHSSTSCTSCFDAFVSRVNITGNALVFSTFLGGSQNDYGYAIALDSLKNVYIAGKTGSDDFPVAGSPVHTKCGEIFVAGVPTGTCVSDGAFDAFVTKLNAAGNALAYSGFVGGTGWDWATGIAVDSAGEAYLTGQSSSPTPTGDPNNPGFPITPSGFQTTLQPGGTSMFLVKLNASGGGPLYGSFLGSPSGGAGSTATGIAIDGTGKAYIVGQTGAADFPVTAGAFQTTCAPVFGNGCTGARGAVAKFDPSLSGTPSLVYSTYLGGHPGSGNDVPQAVAVDAAGGAYVVGGANSPNFPTTAGAFQALCNSGSGTCAAAFLTKFNAAGSGLVYSTFIGDQPVTSGSSNSSKAFGVRVDSAKNAYVTGQVQETVASSPSFPVLHPIQTLGQVFVTKLNSSGTALLFSTHFGSNGQDIDQPTGIAVDKQGSAYVTGLTFSSVFSVTSTAFQKVFKGPNGGTDGFVFKIATVAADLAVKNSAQTTVNSGSNLPYSITVTNDGPDTATGVSVSDSIPAGTTFVSLVSSAGTCSTPAVGGTGSIICKNITLNKGSSVSLTLTVKVNAPSTTVISDTVKATSPVFDPNSANNSAKVLTTVN